VVWWDSIYHIWIQGTVGSYGENCLTEEQIIKKISWDVKAIMGHSALAAQTTILHKVLRTNWGFLKFDS